MDKAYQKISLVVDAIKSAEAATATAFELAARHGASVSLVDTLRPPSATARWFHGNAEEVFDMVLADKQQRLDKIAQPFREAGIETSCEVLFGKSSEAITQHAIDNGIDLVIRYLKGVRSSFPGRFGNTARNLMRICPCPLLLVGDKPLESPKVLACVNVEHGDAENQAILNESNRLATDKEHCHALYCWNLYGEDYLRHHLAESAYQRTLEESEKIFRGVHEKFVQQHDLNGFCNGLQIENGDPSVVIPRVCETEFIDVVVMSSASLNHPVLRLLGSTVESVLEVIPCSLLVVKPLGFESPVRPTRQTATT